MRCAFDISEYLEKSGICYEYDKPANEFTTFKIGGKCKIAAYPESREQIASLVQALKENGEKYCVIGAGSNVLFSDAGYDGTVVMTSRLNNITVDGCTVTADCGASLFNICKTALSSSLTGLEWAYGIPGSLGGAVYMNAGAYIGEIKDVISSVTVFSPENNTFVAYKASECTFGYRSSRFQSTDEIVLSSVLNLTKGEHGAVKAAMSDFMQRRLDKQPLNYPSAGSAFKRYPGRYTAQMIDAAGLKGYTVGGAQVSEKHAGFIVNRGGATCADVKNLIEVIKERIKEREGVDIECEIRFID